jgi:acetyl-CoA C-acetyltransferase
MKTDFPMIKEKLNMKKVVLVGAVRTPIGDFGGSLSKLKPTDLMKSVIEESLKRANVKPEQLDFVAVGNCFSPIDQNVARVSSLLLGLPYEVPGITINCACSSGMQAVNLSTMYIEQGIFDVAVAGGVESMSNVPYLLEDLRWGQRLRHVQTIDLLWKSMQEYPVGGGMGIAAERLAQKYNISREEQDLLAFHSHQRAVRATKEGRFRREILPLEVPKGKGKTTIVDTDEHPKEDTSLESLASLKPAFQEGGSVTAGNASSLNDGAAAVVLASEEKAEKLGLPVLAEVRAHSIVAVDPHLIGIASVPAIKNVLAQTGLRLEDINLFEVNEAFASYYLACQKELGLNPEITNVNGSGISLGHPVGCTGCRILITLFYEMERQNLKRGIAGLCAGGGIGTAVMLER